MDKKIKILFVDDEQSILNTLKRIFLDYDYTILCAASGQEALNILEKEEVQIVVSDYRMPVMNGAEFLKQVSERWPDTIRIVLSGYADADAILSSINKGNIYKFIPKPWNNNELIVTISNSIERYFLVKKNVELNTEIDRKNKELTVLNDKLNELLEEKSYSLNFTDKILTLYENIFKSLPIAVCGIDLINNVLVPNPCWNDIMDKDWYIYGKSIEELIMSEKLKIFIEEIKKSCKAVKQTEINSVSGKLKGFLVDFGDNRSGIILVFIADEMKTT